MKVCVVVWRFGCALGMWVVVVAVHGLAYYVAVVFVLVGGAAIVS